MSHFSRTHSKETLSLLVNCRTIFYSLTLSGFYAKVENLMYRVIKDLPGFRPKKQGGFPKVTQQPETLRLWTSPENTGIIMAMA